MPVAPTGTTLGSRLRDHAMTGRARVEAMLTEDHLQRRVLDLAALRGWRRVHIRPARTERGWRTPYEGDPGLPDLILARRGVVILAELKGSRTPWQPGQREWLAAAGQHGRLWRPANWPSIVEELR